MNSNNLQQISSFKKHHGKTRAKHLSKFKLLSAGHKDETVTSQRLFRKHNNAFTDIRPFKCNLRSSNTESFFSCHKGQIRGKNFKLT